MELPKIPDETSAFIDIFDENEERFIVGQLIIKEDEFSMINDGN